MNNLVVAVVIVVVIIIVYLVMAKNADSLFISSVDTAAKSCDAAIASQNEADFSTAIADIAAAKSARSVSLNQYAPALAAGPSVPAEVTAASNKLEGLTCSQYTSEQAAVAAVSTAMAACNAAKTAPTTENVNTAMKAKVIADKAISDAFQKAVITKALKAAALSYSALDFSFTFDVTGKIAADDSCNIYVNDQKVITINTDWSTINNWELKGLKAGDKVDFEVTNQGGPAGVIASWTTSVGTKYVSNPTTLPCVAPSGLTSVEATYGWGDAYKANFAGGVWVWTDNTNTTPYGTVRKFRWIASP